MEHSQQQVTQLLFNLSNGDKDALEQLIPLVYNELRRLAHHYMRQERPGHMLQTTALVNEAYLRLADYQSVGQTRAHFFALAAQLMRRILVEYARAADCVKRGGGAHMVSLDEGAFVSSERSQELLALDEALDRLAELNERQSEVVVMRFFGGLTYDEIAAVLGMAPRSLKRDWLVAHAWLRRELTEV
jgi:RNA polymerase sigma-70 factor (ECF subfamily)